jgi:uncharacterized protein (DUF305 family)
MVPHHCAAVPMSRSEVERGTCQPATEFARDHREDPAHGDHEMKMMIRNAHHCLS